jgi:sulfite reductase (NADPH) flavoprotein alpha-component
MPLRAWATPRCRRHGGEKAATWIPTRGKFFPGPQGRVFFRTVTQLHRYLASGDVGKHIVGASTLGLVLLALSGLYLRWPRNALDWRIWLKVKWSETGRPFWWSMHSVLGTWVLLCYLLAALTGLYWSYDWYRDALFAVTGAPRPQQAAPPSGARAEEKPAEAVAPLPVAEVDRAWELFRGQVPGFGEATLRLPARPQQPVQVTYLDADAPHPRATNRIQIDVATGEAKAHERYGDKPAGARIMASMFPLHSGSFFGLPGRLAMMVASLVLLVSAVSGWLLYLDRRRKKQRRARRALRPAVQHGE